MKLSVILIGYDSWHFLDRNLASISFLDKNLDSEVIYVDNGSGDGSFLKTGEHYPWVRVLKNNWNEGISVARNQGMKQASGDYILLLDSDTEITKEALDNLLAFMDEHPEVGLCGCKMYGQDGSVQDSCRPFPSIRGKIKAGFQILAKKLHLPVSKTGAYYDKEAAEPFEVDYVIGACQLIRKEARQKVGWLDEKIFYGPEDADFCLRMKRAGYPVYYLPQTAIYHAYQRVSSHRIFSQLNKKHIQGLCYYFWKHRIRKKA
jgi:GT2 family glycosyltransferase